MSVLSRQVGRAKWLMMRCGACGVIALALLLAGCQMTPTSAPRSAKSAKSADVMDPCAERLHEICGQLLLFYSRNRHLPAKLEDLRSMPAADPSLSLECPISHRPYVYERQGLLLPDVRGRVIIYDVQPVHAGWRWVIAIDEITEGDPLIARVMAVADSKFSNLTW